MSNYSQITNFTAKDSLSPGDPNKIIYGALFDPEFAAISTAIATKYDTNTASITLSNTLTAATVAAGTITWSGVINNLTATYPTASSSLGLVNINNAPYADTGVVIQAWGTVNSFGQIVLGNTNTGAAASADFIVGNSATTATNNYGDFGINGTGFTGTGNLNKAGAVYLYSAGVDLSIGTSTANPIHFVVNSGATDAMTIGTTGATVINSPTSAAVALTVNSISGSSGLVVQGPTTGTNTNFVIQDTAASYQLYFQNDITNTANVIGSSGSANRALNIKIGNTTAIGISAAGAVTMAGTLGINGAAGTTAVAGWGTPVGNAVIANYNITDIGGANSNTNKAVAYIILALKNFGLFAN